MSGHRVTTGPWNFSYAALKKTKECVLAVPGADLLNTAVGIGTCSGAQTDKFAKFGLTPIEGRKVGAPLITEGLANIECVVTDIIPRHNIVILNGVAAHVDSSREERPTLHAVGDGTFVADGRKFDRRKMMRSKLPEGF